MVEFWTIVSFKLIRANLLIFILISLAMTFICEKLPKKLYYYKRWMFKERHWEKGGKIYDTVFKVKKWKAKLPEISDFMRWRFKKKHLAETNSNYLSVFITESCKAEFTHWLIIISTVIFYIWNGFFSGFLMFLLATILNFPYIIIQRYNRPRLLRLIKINNRANKDITASAQ